MIVDVVVHSRKFVVSVHVMLTEIFSVVFYATAKVGPTFRCLCKLH